MTPIAPIETVNRQLTALRKRRIIELRGARSAAVTDYPALALPAGEEPAGAAEASRA